MEIYYGTVKRIAFAWDSAEKPKNPMVWRGRFGAMGIRIEELPTI